MILGSFTYLDAALAAVAFISGLLAMYRGLAREVLSIVSWIAAAGAGAWIFFKQKDLSADVAAQTGLPPQIALAVVAIGVAMIVLILVHLVTARISDAILDSRVGMIDRVLGFIFGALRGFILIVIPYMFYESFVPDDKQQFPWLKESQSLPYIKSAGNAIRNGLVQYLPSPAAAPPDKPAQGEQQGYLMRDGRLVALALDRERYYMTRV